VLQSFRRRERLDPEGPHSSLMSAVIAIGMQPRTLLAAGHFCSWVATARSAAARFPAGTRSS